MLCLSLDKWSSLGSSLVPQQPTLTQATTDLISAKIRFAWPVLESHVTGAIQDDFYITSFFPQGDGCGTPLSILFICCLPSPCLQHRTGGRGSRDWWHHGPPGSSGLDQPFGAAAASSSHSTAAPRGRVWPGGTRLGSGLPSQALCLSCIGPWADSYEIFPCRSRGISWEV